MCSNMYYFKMLYYRDPSSTFIVHMAHPALEGQTLVVWHKIHVCSSHVCCVSWEGPEESVVLPLWDLKFCVCKEEARVRAVPLAAAIDFPAMVNGHQGTVEQDEGQWASVWQGRASLGVMWSALCLEWASALVAALMRNHK